MCGIAGYIQGSRKSTLPYASDIMKDIIYFNRLRGTDAFGMCRVSRWDAQTKVDKVQVEKQVGDPYTLANHKSFEDMWKFSMDVRYLIAHNRLATKGEKTQVCAQPFVAEKSEDGPSIVLVHNGTIHNINGGNEYPGETDSHQLTKMLASGMSLDEFESRVFGAFALVWYDEADGSLNFFRNNDRPLSLVSVPGGVYFGSEAYIVAAAIARHNGGQIDKITNIQPHDHWKYHYDEGKFETKKVTLLKKSFGGQSNSGDRLPNTNAANGDVDDWLKTSFPSSALALPAPSKSGSSSSIRHDSIIVEPFHTPGGTKSTPVVVARANGELEIYATPISKAKVGKLHKNKPRYTPTLEAMGFSKGDSINFSLLHCRQTKRPNQLVLEGIAVSFGDGFGPASLKLIPRMEVQGMMGMDNAFASIHSEPNLMEGKITDIRQCDELKNGIYAYKIMVCDIKISSQYDIFRGKHKAAGILDIAPYVKPPEQAPIIVKQEEREFADTAKKDAKKWLGALLGGQTEDTSEKPRLRFFTCDRCSGTFAPTFMYRHQKHYDQDEFDVIVRVCNSCNNAFAKDQTLLDNLFQTKLLESQDQALKEVENKSSNPTLH